MRDGDEEEQKKSSACVLYSHRVVYTYTATECSVAMPISRTERQVISNNQEQELISLWSSVVDLPLASCKGSTN